MEESTKTLWEVVLYPIAMGVLKILEFVAVPAAGHAATRDATRDATYGDHPAPPCPTPAEYAAHSAGPSLAELAKLASSGGKLELTGHEFAQLFMRHSGLSYWIVLRVNGDLPRELWPYGEYVLVRVAGPHPEWVGLTPDGVRRGGLEYWNELAIASLSRAVAACGLSEEDPLRAGLLAMTESQAWQFYPGL